MTNNKTVILDNDICTKLYRKMVMLTADLHDDVINGEERCLTSLAVMGGAEPPSLYPGHGVTTEPVTV